MTNTDSRVKKNYLTKFGFIKQSRGENKKRSSTKVAKKTQVFILNISIILYSLLV